MNLRAGNFGCTLIRWILTRVKHPSLNHVTMNLIPLDSCWSGVHFRYWVGWDRTKPSSAISRKLTPGLRGAKSSFRHGRLGTWMRDSFTTILQLFAKYWGEMAWKHFWTEPNIPGIRLPVHLHLKLFPFSFKVAPLLELKLLDISWHLFKSICKSSPRENATKTTRKEEFEMKDICLCAHCAREWMRTAAMNGCEPWKTNTSISHYYSSRETMQVE